MPKPILAAGALLLAAAAALPPPADADPQRRSRGSRDRVARAVPRPVPRVVRPQVTRIVPYRYVAPRYSYRYGYRGYPAPYGFYGGYYPSYYGSYYGGYGYPGYRYAPHSYFVPVPGRPYGGVRIDLPQRHAEVFVDGYFVGTVDDFDGVFQQVNFEPGPHRIEVRAPGYEPISFEVNVRPGETVTYRAPMRVVP